MALNSSVATITSVAVVGPTPGTDVIHLNNCFRHSSCGMSSSICLSATTRSASVAFKEAWQFLATGPPERLFVQGLINETLLFTDGLLKLLADQY